MCSCQSPVLEAAGAWCFHWHIAHIRWASQAERLGHRIGHSQPQRNTRFQYRAQYNRESHKALEFSKRCLRRKARGAFRPWRARNCTWESYGPFQEQKGLIPPSAHHIKKITHKSRNGCVESAVVAAADGASVSTVTLCDSITFHVVEEKEQGISFQLWPAARVLAEHITFA